MEILLVEDHVDTARLMQRLLAMKGHQVKVVHTRAAALAAAGQPFDLLVTDVHLPDGEAYDLLDHVNAEMGIVVSGSSRSEDADRVHKGGFAAQLLKPIDIQKFFDLIETFDEQKKATN